MYQVIVIGGGISGLAFSYQCACANIDHLLLESSARLGGCIETHRPVEDEGASLEIGAHSLHNSYRNTIGLIEKLGLSVDPLERAFVGLMDGERISSIIGRLSIPSLMGNYIYRLIVDLVMEPNREILLLDEIARYIGRGNAERVARPLLRALYNQPISGIPSKVLFGRKRSMVSGYPRSFTLRGGLETLPLAIGKTINFRLDSRVSSINNSKGYWIVGVGEETLMCRNIALAVSADQYDKFSSLVSLGSTDIHVSFTSSVIEASDVRRRSIVASTDENIFSYVKKSGGSNFEVCHHVAGLDKNGRYVKSQVLPKLSSLGKIYGRYDSVYLVGNYVSGLSIEQCVSYSNDIFSKFQDDMRR